MAPVSPDWRCWHSACRCVAWSHCCSGDRRRSANGGHSLRFSVRSDAPIQQPPLGGATTFALWPLEQAAQSCFGRDEWPDDTPGPQAWLEFEVDDVEQASICLEGRGHRALVRNRKEPWGQVVSRFLSSEGLLMALSFTPALRAVEAASGFRHGHSLSIEPCWASF